MRNSREVAFLKGATGSCRWGLHFVDALSDRTVFTDVPETDPVEPDTNFLPRRDILEAVEKFLERKYQRERGGQSQHVVFQQPVNG
jgi:hypothetical protein